MSPDRPTSPAHGGSLGSDLRQVRARSRRASKNVSSENFARHRAGPANHVVDVDEVRSMTTHLEAAGRRHRETEVGARRARAMASEMEYEESGQRSSITL